MADPTHPQTRLWLRQTPHNTHGHIAPGCSHDWGDTLCGLPAITLGTDATIDTICPDCLHAWRTGTSLGGTNIMLPRGRTHLLRRDGTLQYGSNRNHADKRAHAITHNLNPLSPEDFGTLGHMPLSLTPDGDLHGDTWCSHYNADNTHIFPVSMGKDSVVPHHAGTPLHCHRGLPHDVEDAFVATLATCRARNGLLATMQNSGWSLYEAIRHEKGMHGINDDHVCESGAYEVEPSLTTAKNALPSGNVPPTVVEENSRTAEVWEAISHIFTGWGDTEEARVELGRTSLLLTLATHDSPNWDDTPGERLVESHPLSSAISSVVLYGITDAPYLRIFNVASLRIGLSQGGWLSPLKASSRVIEEAVLPHLGDLVPSGSEAVVAEDLADFMMSQDHVLEELAEQYLDDLQSGVFLEVESVGHVPAYWAMWPHGVDDDGRCLCWVPSPVVEALDLDSVGASPGPYLPLTSREARALLTRMTRLGAR